MAGLGEVQDEVLSPALVLSWSAAVLGLSLAGKMLAEGCKLTPAALRAAWRPALAAAASWEKAWQACGDGLLGCPAACLPGEQLRRVLALGLPYSACLARLAALAGALFSFLRLTLHGEGSGNSLPSALS